MGSAKRVVAIPGEDAAAEAFAATMSLLEDFSLDLDWSSSARRRGRDPDARRALSAGGKGRDRRL